MKLPDKWAIKTHEPEFYEFFNQLPDVENGISYPYVVFNGYLHYPSYDKDLDCYESSTVLKIYTEITFEQLTQSEEWKAWKEKKDVVVDFGDHKVRIVNTERRKIKGYKVPFDIPFWDLKEGDLIIEHGKDLDFYSNGSVVPKQVVRSWQKEYCESKEDVLHEIDLILGCYSTSTYKDKEEFNRVIEKLKPLFKKLEELK